MSMKDDQDKQHYEQNNDDDDDEMMKELSDDSSDSDSDSSDDSSDDENQHDTEHSSKAYEVDHLEIKLREDPYSFEKNVEYIDALKEITKPNSQTNLERLRKARESFQSLFPLPESIWIDWLLFEIKLSKTEQDYIYLDSLFEKAINDYISIKISIMYCSYKESIIFSKLSSGLLNINSFNLPILQSLRDLFERMIKKNGGDISEASKLWKRYIAFEKIVLSNLTDKSECAQSIKYLNSLYCRLLSSPVLDIIDCFAEFKEWEHSKETNDDYVEGLVEKAIKEVDNREEYEKAVAETDKQHAFPKWKQYIDYEKSIQNNIQLTMAVYERAVKVYYNSIELWQGYLEFVQNNVSSVDQDTHLSIFSRAVRNVYWSGDIWAGYMRALERYSQPMETICGVFERGLVAGLSTVQDCQTLFNALLDYQWRAVQSKSQRANSGTLIVSEQDREIIRSTFQRICDYFAQVDSNILLDTQLYWANFELELFGQWSEYVKIMEMVLVYNASLYQVWDQYIGNTMKNSTKEEVRQLYQKSIALIQDNGKIWQDWLNFERQFGSLRQYEDALKQYHTATMKWLNSQQQNLKPREHKQSSAAAKGKGSKGKKEKPTAEKSNKKERKRKSKDDEQQDQGIDTKTNGKKSNGIDKKEEQVQQEQHEDKRKSKKIKTNNDNSENNNNNNDNNIESCSIFVSSLPFETKEEEIQQIFEKCGEIKSIRLIRDKRGKSKGICFIDFSNSSESKKALELNGHMIDKFSLRVEYSKNTPPPTSTTTNESTTSTSSTSTTTTTENESTKIDYNNVEEKTVFINNLSPKITNELLEEYFTKNNILFSSIRVKNNKGSRPFAYVDLVDKDNLQKALALNQKYFMGKSINVYISKPPGSKSSTNVNYQNTNNTNNNQENTNNNNTDVNVQIRKPTLLIPRGMLKKK